MSLVPPPPPPGSAVKRENERNERSCGICARARACVCVCVCVGVVVVAFAAGCSTFHRPSGHVADARWPPFSVWALEGRRNYRDDDPVSLIMRCTPTRADQVDGSVVAQLELTRSNARNCPTVRLGLTKKWMGGPGGSRRKKRRTPVEKKWSNKEKKGKRRKTVPQHPVCARPLETI